MCVCAYVDRSYWVHALYFVVDPHVGVMGKTTPARGKKKTGLKNVRRGGKCLKHAE